MSKIDDISDQLFHQFQSTVSVHGERPGSKKVKGEKERQVEVGLQQLYAAAAIARQERRLGVIGRARVAFSLQDKMVRAGYPPALVRQVLFALLASAFVGRQS